MRSGHCGAAISLEAVVEMYWKLMHKVISIWLDEIYVKIVSIEAFPLT